METEKRLKKEVATLKGRVTKLKKELEAAKDELSNLLGEQEILKGKLDESRELYNKKSAELSDKELKYIELLDYYKEANENTSKANEKVLDLRAIADDFEYKYNEARANFERSKFDNMDFRMNIFNYIDKLMDRNLWQRIINKDFEKEI